MLRQASAVVLDYVFFNFLYHLVNFFFSVKSMLTFVCYRVNETCHIAA